MKKNSKKLKSMIKDVVDGDFEVIDETKKVEKAKISQSNKSPLHPSNDVLIIHWNGRFGNRMHTYAYAHERAKKFGGQLYLPSEWEGDRLFNLNHKIINDERLRLHLNQSIQPFDNLNYRIKEINDFNQRSKDFNFVYVNADNPAENFKKLNKDACIDSVCAYHSSIFKNMSLKNVLSLYEFSDEVKNLDCYKRLEDKQGTYDIAHLRRDDISNVRYKNNGGYSVVNKDSYEKAFKKFDIDPSKMEWTTDDWTAKWGVGTPYSSGMLNKRGKWNYPVGSEYIPEVIFDWLPDFLRIYFARNIFRANSSFSFWACTLSKGRETPPNIFAPRLDKRILYAKEETLEQEADFEFEKGNHPHWLCVKGQDECEDIIFNDE